MAAMNVLGVILARGGSKRVPNKNIRDLGGHPLIAWTIEAAQRSLLLDDIVVSSDSTAILNIARQYRVAALRRPKAMATDTASSYPALMHAVDSFDKPHDWVCLLQPTSPFRTQIDIDNCLINAHHFGQAAVVAVEEGAKVPNGSIYVAHIDWLREVLARGVEYPFDSEACAKYHMPSLRSLDIDTEEDFQKAEEMLEAMAA